MGDNKMTSDKLMLIDGNSILNRAYYGLQGAQMLSTADGLYTNAVFGFLNILFRFFEEEKPQYVCVAFDLKAPTFRHKAYDGYKAKRKGMPPELAVQVPVIKEVLDAMRIKRLEMEGFEADDIIGSVSLCAEKKGMQVVIVTGDRDSLQLASRTTRIKIPSTKGGRTEVNEYDDERIVEKYGVTPAQLIDVKGLMGDASDNIPGVPGVGEKTALDLIKKYGTLEKLYESLDTIEKKSLKEKLENNRELAFLSMRLATIDRHMQELCAIEDLKVGEFDHAKLYALFKKLEFKSFIEKLKLAPAESEELCREGMQEGEYEYVTDVASLEQLKEKIANEKEISLFYLLDKSGDFRWMLAGIAIAWAGDHSAFVDLSCGLNEMQFTDMFAEVLENERMQKIGHDMKNFIVYLKQRDINLKSLSFDTMIAAYILNPSRNTYTVSELAQEYRGARLQTLEDITGKGKGFKPFRELPRDIISRTAAQYALEILRLAEPMQRMIAENDQKELYYDIELPLVEVLADMEYRGFKVNINGLKAFSVQLEGRIETLTQEIYDIAGENFNINSTKQLGAVLFEKLGLPVIKKTKTGYSTDAEVLEELSSKHEIISKILEYRQLVKLKSTYAEGLLHVVNPSDSRIHSSFNQTVTTTGRISSTEPNLQNIPVKLEMGREIRRVFVAENEQYLLLDADYSQIELRVLAHITGDTNMIEAFKNNQDIHTSTAARVFKVEHEQVTSLMRSRAKAVNFGIVYGIGDFSLSKDLGITRKEARKYIDEYLDQYPKVRQYMHDIVEQGKTYGFVTTLFNRRRYLPELKSSNFNMRSFGERIAMNTPIQGSAADIIKIAMVKVYEALKENKLKSRLILQVHDELVVETFQDEMETVKKLVKQCMEQAAVLSAPLVADVSTGHDWYEAK